MALSQDDEIYEEWIMTGVVSCIDDSWVIMGDMDQDWLLCCNELVMDDCNTVVNDE